MKKCTKVQTFTALMNELEAGDTEVIMTVIENFLCDSVGSEMEKSKILFSL